MRDYIRNNHIYLKGFLILITVITFASTFWSYSNSKKAAEDSLKLQAIGISASLEISLSNIDLRRQENILKEIITEGKWEGIAFISLHDKDGTIILHSNKNLIGIKALDRNLKGVIDTGIPSHTYITLGTSEKVFIFDFPVHLSGSERILRLALHTYPAQKIVRQARIQMFGMFFIVAVLWIVGYFFARALRRSDELRMKMAERERFAIIGEMASVLAHEIRNPLSSIKGFAQYMKEQRIDDTIERAYILDIIVSESKRLETLTEELLMYAKPTEVRLEDFDLYELIDEVVNSIKDNKGVNLRISVPSGLIIRSDKNKLRQIFLNILQNSIDAKSKTVEIETEDKGSTQAIIIRDDGIGMSQEIQKNAFKPFFTTKTRGTGLGLAIVDKLIKALGGEINLISAPQQGTTFRIVIPKIL